MPTIKYKPTTPARRNMSVPSFEEITKFTPEKSLLAAKKKNSGRNSYGRITVRHKGAETVRSTVSSTSRDRTLQLRPLSALNTTRTVPLTSPFFRTKQARRATSSLLLV